MKCSDLQRKVMFASYHYPGGDIRGVGQFQKKYFLLSLSLILLASNLMKSLYLRKNVIFANPRSRWCRGVGVGVNLKKKILEIK